MSIVPQTTVELLRANQWFDLPPKWRSVGYVSLVLDSVDFSTAEGKIVSLLGKSGSGKSTLLRIMAGLISTDADTVSYCGKAVHGPASLIAMVFQSFALFPWLTVQQNAELGLDAQAVAPAKREEQAGAMLEPMGLAGFSDALPRERSGGIRQRVGIDRALVTKVYRPFDDSIEPSPDFTLARLSFRPGLPHGS